MYSKECRNKIRYSLSDASGVLRFTAFNIVDAPECGDIQEMLRQHLVGRPLADVDLDDIRGLRCKGDGECIRTVIRVIEESQHMFVRMGKEQ